MSQQTSPSPSVDRTETIGLLKRVAKYLKKSTPDQQLAAFQNKIAHSFGYSNWSMLHKNVLDMTPSRFEAFAVRVLQNDDVHLFLSTQSKFANARQIKCTLFTKNIGYVAREFKDGDAQAIVLADTNKIKAVLESNEVYYYSVEKVKMHKGALKKGAFEVPLVAPRGDYLHWIEGFHQVTAAIEEGLTVLPIGTSMALAQQLKALVGLSDPDLVANHSYDFSECAATLV